MSEQLPQRQVLVVDDDIDIREALQDFLVDRGFDAVTAANGVEGLQILRSSKVLPSVILVDLMMPVMDGYTFLEELRKDPALAEIPVAVITAGRTIDRARIGKAAPIIPKPIDVPKLTTLLSQLPSDPLLSS